MTDTTDHPNTPDEIAEALDAAGFAVAEKPAGAHLIGGPASDWWELVDERGDTVARVSATLEEGTDVFAFIGPRQMLAWSARFTSRTPVEVLAAVLLSDTLDAAVSPR